MKPLQTAFIAATFLVPVIFWALRRWAQARGGREAAAKAERAMRWSFTTVLVAAYGGALGLKGAAEGLDLKESLPLQLCDWAAVATFLALVGRGQTAFELAYCWGLAGTFQGLVSPAIEIDGGLRVWCFLAIHSVIPASVLWLLLAAKMRPSWAAWRRVFLWSEVYFVTALTANYLAGSNYGFLSHRPPRSSPLDHFPDGWGWYVLSIDAFALVVFAVMLAPWRLAKEAR